MSAKRDAIIDEARMRLGRGDSAGGERSLKKLLRMRPADAEGLYLLGVVQLQAGKMAEAASLMRRALDSGLAGDPVMLENVGTAFLANGDAAAAERELRKAVTAGGTRSVLRMRLGMALLALGRADEAETVLRTAQAQSPHDIDIGINLGNVLAARGQHDAAFEQYSRMLVAAPGHVQILYNIGTLQRDAGRFDAAVAAFEQVLAIVPDHVETLINLGTVREQQGDPAEAERLYRKVLALLPDNALACSNLGNALRAQKRLDEAAQYCQRALTLRPGFVDALANLAGIHADQGISDLARREYHKAWQMAPADDELRLWYGMLGLALGEFAESWPHYQARAVRRDMLSVVGALDDQLPEDISGRTILLVGEQGIGDELFFLRYAGLLKLRHARICCICDRKIHGLLERTGIFEALYAPGDSLPQRDMTFAVGDLPLLLGTMAQAAADVPPALSLQPLPVQCDAMRQYLQRVGPPPYLAVTWRGGTRRAERADWRNQVLTKEVPLHELATALRGYSGSVISLQRNPDPDETEKLSALLGAPVFDASEINADLEKMLALLGLLHEYIGVSNANMHLLAGLNGRARVLVPNPAEWRWMVAGEVSPWFPQFTVYRQATDGSWHQAISRLRTDLLGAVSV